MTSTFARWRYAAKPNSWPKLLVPMLLGQSLGAYLAGRIDPRALAFGVLFVVADLLYIVFLNDWADERVDRIKREMFPDGCSPKTIPDDILPARALLGAGIGAGALGLVIAWTFGHWLDRPWLFAGAAAALAVFWAYTLPPLRLNYRGGGEVLEALGVGFVLPWLNAYAQSGVLGGAGYAVLAPFVVLSLSSAVA
ncbi:MAG: prenyltransferase, partial [Myxococcota bacterium]